jgi:hypothetical protein
MDLVAVGNQEEQLNVYRFGGQRAFGLQRRNGGSKVVSLGWKFNGMSLPSESGIWFANERIGFLDILYHASASLIA